MLQTAPTFHGLRHFTFAKDRIRLSETFHRPGALGTDCDSASVGTVLDRSLTFDFLKSF